MRYFFKYIIRSSRLGDIARFSRAFFYRGLDFLGQKAFFILRTFHLLSPLEEFNKKRVKKILIILLDRIGDVILSTPALRAVREAFPKAEIHLLVRDYTKELLVNNPNINGLQIFKKDSLSKDYDLAIALHPGITQNYLTFTCEAKYRVGYTGWGGGFFLTHTLKDDRSTRIRHEVESALEVVGVAGGKTEDKKLDISVTEEGEKFARDYFKKNNLSSNQPVVAIHPGARQEYIRWNKEGFAEVADRLIKFKNVKVILTGSSKEDQLVKETASLMAEKPVCAVGLRLTQLISLLKKCSLFIGNSTGPMHIAAGLDIPVVAIFGAIHPLDSYQEWRPWNEKHIVVSKNLNCPQCHPTDCKTFECMEMISADDVVNAAEELLKTKT